MKALQWGSFSLLLSLGACSQVKLLVPSSDKEKTTKVDTEKTEGTKPLGEEKKGVKMEPHPESEYLSDTEEPSEEKKQEKANQSQHTPEEKKKIISSYCEKVQKNFDKYKWGKSNCENYPWQFVRTSVKGDPLLWRTYGSKGTEKTETTLIMCGVHGDEITPIKFCYDVIEHMEKVSRGEVIDPHTKKTASLEGKLVIVAPIVNPDSYFKKRPTRTNANGVDVNRNFPTHDFLKSAHSSWVTRYRRDKRRFPGKKPMSEPETIFQVNLIYRYKPNKIISVHAPLTMLDYDGPASAHEGGFVGSRANQLLIRMSEQAKGYRIKNYPFFPGSLGNYAGNERNIPTFTLELPTSDPSKAKSYWKLFKDSIHSAVMHEIRGEGFVALDQEENPLKGSRSN